MTAFAPENFYGQIKNRRSVFGTQLLEVHYRAGQWIPQHFHQHGFFAFSVNGAPSTFNASDMNDACRLTVHAPGIFHGAHKRDADGAAFYVELAPVAEQRLLEAGVPKTPISLQDAESRNLIAKLYREFVTHDSAFDMAAEGLILQLIAHTQRCIQAFRADATPQWLLGARNIILREYANNLPVSDVARRVGVHPNYLSHAFRRRYGSTVRTYTHRLKIEAACALLSTTAITMSRMAADLGFANQAHFSRVFKEHMGLSPLAYKKRHS